MPDRALRPRSGSSAKALLLTILGEFVTHHGGHVWTSTIVEALGNLEVNERNARQAVARLADQGLLSAVRHGRRTRWDLTAGATRLLASGTERIYGFGKSGAPWDGQWLVVLASVPEEQRAKRHQLRSQLEFIGLGFVAPGIAVSPHVDREQAVNAVLGDIGLADSAIVFLARTGTFLPDRELIHRAWDLDALGQRYAAFTTEFEGRTPVSDEDAFVSLVDLVHQWRRFPFGDPEIPDELLPANWPGRAAKHLFDRCHAAWSPAAHAWFLTVHDRLQSDDDVAMPVSQRPS
jgi:phenylacetic acid degradation operon negative regulatory protein